MFEEIRHANSYRVFVAICAQLRAALAGLTVSDTIAVPYTRRETISSSCTRFHCPWRHSRLPSGCLQVNYPFQEADFTTNKGWHIIVLPAMLNLPRKR